MSRIQVDGVMETAAETATTQASSAKRIPIGAFWCIDV